MALTIAALLLTTLFVISVVKLLFYTKKLICLRAIFRDIPGPQQSAKPLIGHAMLLQGDGCELYKGFLGIVEPAVELKHEVAHMWLGNTPFVMICGPNAAEVLLHSSQHTEKSMLYEAFYPWLGTGLLTSAGEKWKTRRKLLTPTFHFKILEDFVEVMNEHSLTFVKGIESYSDSGKAFDIYNPITLCALDIICETALGKSLRAQQEKDSDYVTAIYKISALILRRMTSPWLWPDFLFKLSKTGIESSRLLKVLHSTSRSIIHDRMKLSKNDDALNKKRRLAFLDLLLKISCNGKVLSFQDIQEEVDTFMFEGHDTTSSAMAFAFHLIGANPDVQHRIQEEIDGVFGNEDHKHLTMEDIRKLEYLELVIKEALRLFPSAPIIGRVTSTDCVMDGHHIPAGTSTMLFIQVIQRNRNFWTDPDEFKPERFTTDNSLGRHPFANLTFSAGPRNCIGQKFALLEEKVVIAQVLRKYSIESCDRTEDIRDRLVGDLILRPADGVKIKIKRRN